MNETLQQVFCEFYFDQGTCVQFDVVAGQELDKNLEVPVEKDILVLLGEFLVHMLVVFASR